jgi:5'-nucleotidase
VTRPLVLLSNDDGVTAPGLMALRDALLATCDVVVCAPESNQSATSHSLTLGRVLRLRKAADAVYAVDGTPADSVYVALHAPGRVLPRLPDLCVSGMNHGLNLGVDVFYSGTVAAAREAALRGVLSVAVSADSSAERAAAAAAGARIAMALFATIGSGSSAGRLFNVNVPPGAEWGVRATTLGRRSYESDVVFRTDPRGAEYLWIGGSKAVHHDAPGSDTEAYDAGVIGITPLGLDLHAPAGMALAGEAALAAATGPRPPRDPQAPG